MIARYPQLRSISIPAARRIAIKNAQRSLGSFRVVTHTVKCQHTRERPAGAELGHENELKLHVKQYIPHDNPDPRPGDVTIIGLHANGFPKEVYEPLWDDMHAALAQDGRRIRAVWIADIANQGQSGVLNERLLGPDPGWWDHSRDLLFLINQFQEAMPSPLVGVGHSMGGTQLAFLSLLHPRLFASLVLIDPVIQRDNPSRFFAPASTHRRDTWPTRDDASKRFATSKFYQKWDKRVLENWIQHGLRDLPTELYPEMSSNTDPPVTLTTTKAQEVAMYLRPAYHDERMLQGDDLMQREMHIDDIDESFLMYRPEPAWLYRHLDELHPPTQYIFGRESTLNSPKAIENKLQVTGTGVGGNGGVDRGGVKSFLLDCGHLVPMEATTECAKLSAKFIDMELSRWQDEERQRRKRWERLSRQERIGINDAWKEHVGDPPRKW